MRYLFKKIILLPKRLPKGYIIFLAMWVITVTVSIVISEGKLNLPMLGFFIFILAFFSWIGYMEEVDKKNGNRNIYDE